MPNRDPEHLVSTQWLADHLSAPDVRILDASWYLPNDPRDGVADYAAQHIPGARFFDIDEIADTKSDLPHMVPPIEKFVSRVRGLGIGDGHRVVVYDGAGMFSAARVWWLFRHMGKRDVAVLDGGLPKWLAEDRPVTDDPPNVRDFHFTASRDASLVRDVTQVALAVKLKDAQIVDARSPGRFRGDEPEVRPGLRSGHIPGSMNVHYATLLNEDGTMKPADGIKAAFQDAGVDLARPIINSCGSGVTASILALGLELIGHKAYSVYDGSWTEWGAFPELAVETG